MSRFPPLPAPPSFEEYEAAYLSRLRDQFAGQALIGYLAGRNTARDQEFWAKLAYQQADAMLAERSKVTKDPA